ncbi:dsDNA-mimic protein, partial [Haemophilus influenzae]
FFSLKINKPSNWKT